jgi:hypothetical protein
VGASEQRDYGQAVFGGSDMAIDIATLRRRWGWTTLLALIVMGALWALDTHIKAASGYGIMDLEAATTAAGVNTITAAWTAASVAPQMGFLLGLDYLYMASYGLALFYGGLAARDAFAKTPGRARRALTVLAFAPLVGAAFDVMENAFEAKMLFAGATPQLACLAHVTTVTKFAFIVVGLVLSLAGLAGLFMGRLKRA